MDQFDRSRRLVGDTGVERLRQCRVALFGVGGVGGYAAEALARSGIGAIDLIDDDRVCLTNLNRQLVALHSTMDMSKTAAMAARIRDINPDCVVTCHETFYLPETADRFDLSQYDYVIDAIDTVTAKLDLIERCHRAGTPIICALGAGNKLHADKLTVTDISKTHTDPLAKVIRVGCRKRGINHLKVVFSTELPIEPEPARPTADGAANPADTARSGPARRSAPGSMVFVPGAMGLMLAGEVVLDLLSRPDGE